MPGIEQAVCQGLEVVLVGRSVGLLPWPIERAWRKLCQRFVTGTFADRYLETQIQTKAPSDWASLRVVGLCSPAAVLFMLFPKIITNQPEALNASAPKGHSLCQACAAFDELLKAGRTDPSDGSAGKRCGRKRDACFTHGMFYFLPMLDPQQSEG